MSCNLRGIFKYQSKDEILKVAYRWTDKIEMEILRENGPLRQIVMELLFRDGGLMVIKTAQIMNLAYSTVSKERNRVRERLKKDEGLRLLLVRKEKELPKVKI